MLKCLKDGQVSCDPRHICCIDSIKWWLLVNNVNNVYLYVVTETIRRITGIPVSPVAAKPGFLGYLGIPAYTSH